MTRRSANTASRVLPYSLISRAKDRSVTRRPYEEKSTLHERWLMDVFPRAGSPHKTLCDAMLLRKAGCLRSPTAGAALNPNRARRA
jgi:hypothetical protein